MYLVPSIVEIEKAHDLCRFSTFARALEQAARRLTTIGIFEHTATSSHTRPCVRSFNQPQYAPPAGERTW
jgi:hypothetical protein